MLKCPRCGCSYFYEGPRGGGAQNLICANCRAYINHTPLGMKVLYEDAIQKDPSILEWWAQRERENDERRDGDKSLRPKPQKLSKWNPSKR